MTAPTPFINQMKTLRTAFQRLVLLTLATALASCVSSSDLKSKEDFAVAADFKVITPVKPDQIAVFKKLPTGKLSKIIYRGKTYYILPDSARNQAYVGGPKQYQSYQQLSAARQYSQENAQDKKTYDRNKANTAPVGWSQNDSAETIYNGSEYAGWQGWGGWEGQNNNTNARAAIGWY